MLKGEEARACRGAAAGAVPKGLAWSACGGASKPKPCGSDTWKGDTSGLRRSGIRLALELLAV